MMNFTLKSDNKLVNYEGTSCRRLLNRLNKWPSMPLLQIHNKQSIDSKGRSNMEKLDLYSSNSMDLNASKYDLVGTLIVESEAKTPTANCDGNEYGHLFSSRDNEFVSKNKFLSSQKINTEKRKSFSISLQTLECTIDTCKIFESKESVYEQLSDASFLSFDESDASSLLNVLNTLKFNTESDNNQHRETKLDKERGQLENQDKDIIPLKNNENLFYVRRKGAKRHLRDFKDVNKQQENNPDSAGKVASANDSFSIEYLMQFKDRLKEIRKENMIPATRKPIHNGNRFSRVFNYCFLTR